MQKKKAQPQVEEKTASEWQKSLKNEAKKEQMKKAGIWIAIIAAAFIGLGFLVFMAGSTGSSNTTTVTKENLPKVTEGEIIVGKKDAPVTIIEYADFQCPACARWNPDINRLLSEYDGKVRVVYRHFPLRNAHQHAQISGQAAQAAFNQGKFSEMKNTLFDKQNDWASVSDPKETFIAYAEQIGMDPVKFEADMNSEETKKKVDAGYAQAMSIGLQSTPTFFIGNQMVQAASYEDFKKLIDEELSKK